MEFLDVLSKYYEIINKTNIPIKNRYKNKYNDMSTK
jgi:hypothetical protein